VKRNNYLLVVGVALPIAAASWMHTGRTVLEWVWSGQGCDARQERVVEPERVSPCAMARAAAVASAEVEQAAQVVQPSAELSARDVVSAQMDALRRDDIATVFTFASPANRAFTGPLERFDRMVRSSAYSPMIGHESVRYGDMDVIVGDTAYVDVTVVTPEGREVGYQFVLERQESAPYEGFWMTSSVMLQ